MARTGGEGAKGVSAFLVPADLGGVSVGRPEKKMGQQGAHVCDVHFDEVPVPAANRLGDEGEGFKIAMRVLDRGRLHIAAICVGICERLIADAVGYAVERRQFGKPLADFQLIQAMIADSKTEALAARALVFEAADLKDRVDQELVRGTSSPLYGKTITLEAAAAKYFASEAVGRVADRAVQIFGGAGYIADYGIERLYRDVRLFPIYEGTSQIQQLVIARETIRNGG